MAGLLTAETFIRDLERAGFEFAVDGSCLRIRPADRVSRDLDAELRSRKVELLPIVWRLAEMRRLASVAPRAVVYACEFALGGPGRCFSCGDPLPHPAAYGRCTPCDIAADVYYTTRLDAEACEVVA